MKQWGSGSGSTRSSRGSSHNTLQAVALAISTIRLRHTHHSAGRSQHILRPRRAAAALLELKCAAAKIDACPLQVADG